ncbi:hypothetical protein [Pseudogemmobacter hezensis]|nr:hypothetical protein [Pseudogemmobacter hezensis]
MPTITARLQAVMRADMRPLLSELKLPLACIPAARDRLISP